MNDGEAHSLQGADDGAGGCRASRHDLDLSLQATLVAARRECQHIEHDRRAAQMTHAQVLDLVEYLAYDDGALDHMGSTGQSDGPAVAPAIAVKHGHGPEMDALGPEPCHHRLAEGAQIGAAMMVDDPFGIAGRPRGVVQRNRLPLVFWHVDGSRGIAAGKEILVLDAVAFRRVPGLWSADLDQGWRMIELGKSSPGDRHQL